MNSSSPDYDYVGGELELFADARRWKQYFKDVITPYLHGDVLEVGRVSAGPLRFFVMTLRFIGRALSRMPIWRGRSCQSWLAFVPKWMLRWGRWRICRLIGRLIAFSTLTCLSI